MYRKSIVAALVALALVVMSQPSQATAYRIEAGSVDLAQTLNGQTTFEAVTFAQAYATAPIVIAMPTDAGADPTALRIRNVTTTGFEIAQVEPLNRDGQHAAMPDVSYLVMQAGTAVLPDGTIIEAGFHSTSTTVQKFGGGGGYDSLAFANNFGTGPALLTMIQTMNNESATDPPPGGASTPWLTTATQSGSISATGANIALERAEVNDGATVSVDEVIGYIAMTPGAGVLPNGVLYDAFISTDTIDGWDNNGNDGSNGNGDNIAYNQTFATAPLVLASLARRDGADGGWLRRGDNSAAGVNLTVDEDNFTDAERSHTTEGASIVAFSEAFAVTIPEPMTAMMGVIGLGALAMRRRRLA